MNKGNFVTGKHQTSTRFNRTQELGRRRFNKNRLESTEFHKVQKGLTPVLTPGGMWFPQVNTHERHAAVMRIVANRRKWQRKLKREGESELPPFHQNLLIPLDFSRLRQIVIKLGSRLLTEVFQFDCHLDIPTKRARRLGPKDVRTIFGPPSVQFKRLVAARVSVGATPDAALM
jgi:hypothetical protein